MVSQKKWQEFHEAREEMIKKMLAMKDVYKFERYDSKNDNSTEFVCLDNKGRQLFNIKRTVKKHRNGISIKEYQFDMLGVPSKIFVDVKDKARQEEIKYIDVAISKIKPTVSR